jgi:hypothetical protein
MSTKMYNFYQYPRNDIFALQQWLEALRPKCQQYSIQEIVKYHKLIKGDLWDRLMEDTTTGLRSPFNIDSSVVVYLDGIDIYVQFFGVPYKLYAQEVVDGMLINNEYQDQTDQPEDVSDEEWDRRDQLIDRLLNKHDSGMPSKCGFSFVLMDKHDCMWVCHQVQKHLHVVGWHVNLGWVLCTECSPNPPTPDTPKWMEIDLERLEETPCVQCGRVFSHGDWRVKKEQAIQAARDYEE